MDTQQQQPSIKTTNNNRRRRKRCQSKRKLRRFIKRCVKRGLNNDERQQLIDEFNQTDQEVVIDVVIESENNDKISSKSSKRKRLLPTSVSQRSISQRSSKKIKYTTVQMNVVISKKEINKNLPKYLKKASYLLFQNLRLHLKKKLNKLTQKQFIYHRLRLLDQQYRLQLHQHLWQSYFALGSEYQLWPNQVYKLAKSNEHQSCRQYVIDRLADLNRKNDQCAIELKTHCSSCPSKLLPCDKLDRDLKEFVDLQEDYLSKKLSSQLIRYQDRIEENKLLQTLSTDHLTNHQREAMDRLNHLRQCQLDVFEDLLKLETQVSMEFLPKQFNDIETFIRPNFYSPILKNQLAIELKQKQYKTIQEAKRTWLNINVDIHEILYQDYEHQYQKEFLKFQSISFDNSSQSSETITPFNSFITCMNYRTNRIKQEIYSEKIPIYRRKLLHRRQHMIQRANYITQHKLHTNFQQT